MSRLAWAAVLILAGAFSNAHAQLRTWFLEDVYFEDGVGLGGELIYEASSDTYGYVFLRTTDLDDPLTPRFFGGFPGIYADGINAPSGVHALLSPQPDPLTGSPSVVLRYEAPLTHAGGTIDLAVDGASFLGICAEDSGLECGAFSSQRRIVSGRITTEPIREGPFCFFNGFGATGNCYERVHAPAAISWDDARDAAAARTFLGVPGHLATLESQFESDFIFDSDRVHLAPDMAPYIGGECKGGPCDDPTDFTWITGEPIGELDWCDGEPNGDPDGVLHFFWNTRCWNDVIRAGGESRTYFVEYEVSSLWPACFTGGFGATDNCYEVVVNAGLESWEQARLLAEASRFTGQAGHLATITSDEEQQFIAQRTGPIRLRIPAEVVVTMPEPVADRYAAGVANFGPALTSNPVAGALGAARDEEGVLTDGCTSFSAASVADVAGGIALIDRGTCSFVVKVYNAQLAGAVGAIIVNNQVASTPPTLGTDQSFEFLDDIAIPAVSVTLATGELLRANLGEGVTLGLESSGPAAPRIRPYLGGQCLDGQCSDPLDFSWITGEPVTYTNWCQFEGGGGEPTGDLGGVLEIFDDRYCWNDTVGESPIFTDAFMVEYELPTDGPHCYDEGPGATLNCYEFVPVGEPLSWDSAREAAELREFEGLPGRLVTINSAAEQAFVSAVFGGLSASAEPLLRIDAPEALAGIRAGRVANFGPSLSQVGPLSGNLALVEDNAGDMTDGCEPLAPASATAVSGNVALVNRGGCTFVQKVKNAQDAGAIAVIVANNVPGLTTNLGGSDESIVIPSIGIDQATGAALREAVGEGVSVTLLQPGLDNRRPYLGGRCIGGNCEHTRDFEWVSGEPVSYLGWCGSAPINFGPEQVLVLTNDRFCWVDFPGEGPVDPPVATQDSYIVEYVREVIFRGDFEEPMAALMKRKAAPKAAFR